MGQRGRRGRLAKDAWRVSCGRGECLRRSPSRAPVASSNHPYVPHKHKHRGTLKRCQGTAHAAACSGGAFLARHADT